MRENGIKLKFNPMPDVLEGQRVVVVFVLVFVFVFALTRRAASVLGEDYDAEVVEMHHRFKSADNPFPWWLRMLAQRFNVFGNNNNYITSAETAYKVKERFIEEFGAPIFTIGYEQAKPAAVMAELKRAKVKTLVDTRAVAASRRPGFSKRQLAASLDEQGIAYIHLQKLGTPAAGREAAHRVRGLFKIDGEEDRQLPE